jgi:hypothetical protein
MVIQMRRCRPADIDALRASGDAANKFVAPDDFADIPEDELIDLDKAWHAIHFLLTGKADEAGLPSGGLFAGEEIGEDWGMGPPRLLSPADVKVFASFLADKPDDFVEQAMDFSKLREADIYPNMWDEKGEILIEYVSANFRSLKSFTIAAAERSDAVAIILM